MNTITRRAAMRAIAATATATAALAVPVAAAAANTDAEAQVVLAVWRPWWGHTVEWHRLAAESQRIWDTLPEEVQVPRVEIFEDPRDRKAKIATSKKEIERLTHPQAYVPMSKREKARRAVVRQEKLAELAEREREAEAYIIASGHRAVADQMFAVSLLGRSDTAAFNAMTATTPIAIAARCHFALDGLAQRAPKDYIDCTPESRGLARLIRDLRPQLPAEMAAAMAPIADGWRPLRDIWMATTGDEVAS